MTKLIYASDYKGVELRKKLVQKSLEAGQEAQDIGIDEGSPLDYVDISKRLADELLLQKDALGIMVCGSGQGVAIALNRFSHIRAGMCRTKEDALNIREKLNANVITLGATQNTVDESFAMVQSFQETSFKEQKHLNCVQKLETKQTQHSFSGVNLIVRALIIHENHILLTTTTQSNKDFDQNLFFLPGGHVEHNEPVLEAIKRELYEEMRVTVKEAYLKGSLECSWNRKGSIYHEINFVFLVKVEGLDLNNPPKAQDHAFHKFVWVPLDEIQNKTILPEALKPLIEKSFEKEENESFYSQMMGSES